MAQLHVPEHPWDVIWAEGSAYIIGVERALRDWRPLLRPGGVLVFSEMFWRNDVPSDALRAYVSADFEHCEPVLSPSVMVLAVAALPDRASLLLVGSDGLSTVEAECPVEED